MSEHDPWGKPPLDTGPVPARYRGVWQRTLLQTPQGRDESTFVRWMQLSRWHADLRVPPAARPAVEEAALRQQQGFCGLTAVETDAQGEVCTWHRLVDYQPPGPKPDAGRMVFEDADCVIETGIHGEYLEVWRRLPSSGGRFVALAEPALDEGLPGTRLFMAGRYLMRVRPAPVPWNPAFEISFGEVADGHWQIERSTRPELEGRLLAFALQRQSPVLAQVALDSEAACDWRILAWDEA